MASASIHTLKDLLLPNGQDTRVILSQVTLSQDTEGQEATKTSSFSLPAWDPERLPLSAHLSEDLPSRMQEHLGVIIDQHFSDQVARTSFTNRRGRSVKPDDVLEDLRDRSTGLFFNMSYEAAPLAVTEGLSYQVKVIYDALTGKWLDVRYQQSTINSLVITDRVFGFDGGIKILWGEKSPRAFDRFIGISKIRKKLRTLSWLIPQISPVSRSSGLFCT
jgi:hypothetical protein